MHHSTVSSVLPTGELTLYEYLPTAISRVHDIIPMDVRMEEEYFNLHARYLAETSVQSALADSSKRKINKKTMSKKLLNWISKMRHKISSWTWKIKKENDNISTMRQTLLEQQCIEIKAQKHNAMQAE